VSYRTADEKVALLILRLLRSGDEGWKSEFEAPEHFSECPDVTVKESEVHSEMWFDTGVEAIRLTARLSCPHRGDLDWEWADLGELPDLIDALDGATDAQG
jgi:hypothetical protein